MIESYPTPKPTGLAPRAIIKLAEEIAVDFQDSTGRVDVVALTAKLKGRIVSKDIWTKGIPANEAIVVNGPEDFEIHVSDSSLYHFRNFSIAHELGHYILHFLWNRKSNPEISTLRAFMNREDEITEHEANLFASALLMPTRDVVAATKRTDSPVPHYSISEQFSVPLRNAETWCKAIQEHQY